MASFDFEASFEVENAKMMRASSRATNLAIKRSELARARGARDWTWGSSIEGAKPHRCARAAARTCLAKGAVEAQEDMPSIVCMEGAGKTRHRKPAIAHRAKVQDASSKAGHVDADADEDSTSAGEFDGEEAASSQASPAGGPHEAPQALVPEVGAWPALEQASDSHPAANGAAAEPKSSHREVALRFAVEHRFEQAVLQQRRAQRATAARAAREASAWRTSFRRRRQKFTMARRAQRQADTKARAEMEPARQEEESLAAAMASGDFEMDRDTEKSMRATLRTTNLHIKRTELARARGARDWTWGKGIEAAKPHRCARAAARTCLARGAVEAQEDMPSIVGMEGTGKTRRRKPAIAHVVHAGPIPDMIPDVDADEGDDAASTEAPQLACGPEAVQQKPVSELGAWPDLQKVAAAPQPLAKAADKKGGCTIS